MAEQAPSPFILQVAKFYEPISLALLTLIRSLSFYFGEQKHMTPCLLLPMIILKLNSLPVKYPVILIHFLAVNVLILGEPLNLALWLPLCVLLAIVVETLNKFNQHVFIVIVATNLVA